MISASGPILFTYWAKKLLSFSTLQYVGQFWHPDFCPISVQSLIYTRNSLIFTPISFFNLPMCRQRMWLCPRILSLVQSQGKSARNAQTKGGQGHTGGKKIGGMRTKLFWQAIYCANTRLNLESQSSS